MKKCLMSFLIFVLFLAVSHAFQTSANTAIPRSNRCILVPSFNQHGNSCYNTMKDSLSKFAVSVRKSAVKTVRQARISTAKGIQNFQHSTNRVLNKMKSIVAPKHNHSERPVSRRKPLKLP